MKGGKNIFIMAKDPAFLMYSSAFLTGTMFMNNEQVGIYIKLLCVQHQHGGSIDKLSFNAMVGDNQILRSKFIETEVGFFNEKLMEVMEERNKKGNNISEAVKSVWNNRKVKQSQSNPNAIPLNNNAIASKNDGIAMRIKDKDKDKDIIIIKNKEQGKVIFNVLINQNDWISISCMGLMLPYPTDIGCHNWLINKLREWLKLKIGEGGIEKTEGEIKQHFVRWARIEASKDPEIIKLKNAKL